MPSRLVRLAQQMLSPTASAAEQPPLRGYPYMVQQQKARLTTGGLTLGASRPLEWFTLNDVVMGGRSESSCESDDRGGLVFRGVVSTVGGGFCSCRTTSAQEFSCSPLIPSSVERRNGRSSAVGMKLPEGLCTYCGQLWLEHGHLN
jgi:hypothetical protein